MFSIIFTCVMFMMVLGDPYTNKELLKYYCEFAGVGKLRSCLQNTLSYQVKTVFYDCVRDVAVNIHSPEEIQDFFCNQATEQKSQNFYKCLVKKLNYKEMEICNDKLKKCLKISE
ncbi:uncharacterized protein [Centruroides vittatus]|uniref:uncharacterized protein n=1 Tax=Centruroides vittatus TaxID=120091 RepID=UPI0035107280